jgi:Na+-translocating ferredoxin:NAD+ oxidoreductase RnfC subunit
VEQKVYDSQESRKNKVCVSMSVCVYVCMQYLLPNDLAIHGFYNVI